MLTWTKQEQFSYMVSHKIHSIIFLLENIHFIHFYYRDLFLFTFNFIDYGSLNFYPNLT